MPTLFFSGVTQGVGDLDSESGVATMRTECKEMLLSPPQGLGFMLDGGQLGRRLADLDPQGEVFAVCPGGFPVCTVSAIQGWLPPFAFTMDST